MSQSIRSKDLVIGGRYLHRNGLFVRTIEAIEGSTVHWRDKYSAGSCGKAVFLRQCPSIAPADATVASPASTDSASLAQSGDDFTLRDEANALTAFAFRNGFIEELHAGKYSQLLEEPGYSRITDSEMRRLMIEASAKLAEMLKLKESDPAKYAAAIRKYHEHYCRPWKRD